MEELAGKTAVITGAGSGIGRGMAEYAAAAGMRVVVADVEEPALAETVALVKDAGAEALGVPTDVTDPAAVDALADAAFDRFGAVHLLHNNAGVFQGGISWQRTIADWDWVMRVNFWGVLHGLKSFVPRLLEQEQSGDGDIHIVNTSSLAGVTTTGQSAPYIVSKFAAAALTECLAHDLRGDGVVDRRVVPRARRGRHADRAARPGTGPTNPRARSRRPITGSLPGSWTRCSTTRGRTPLDAAGVVFDGVRANQFWICTAEDDTYGELMRSRYDAIARAPAAADRGVLMIEPFRVEVPDEVLDDLRTRLARTRLPNQIDGAGWDQGTELGYLQELLGYWRDELRLAGGTRRGSTRSTQFLTEVDGQRIHFVHARSPEPDALPLCSPTAGRARSSSSST